MQMNKVGTGDGLSEWLKQEIDKAEEVLRSNWEREIERVIAAASDGSIEYCENLRSGLARVGERVLNDINALIKHRCSERRFAPVIGADQFAATADAESNKLSERMIDTLVELRKFPQDQAQHEVDPLSARLKANKLWLQSDLYTYLAQKEIEEEARETTRQAAAAAHRSMLAAIGSLAAAILVGGFTIGSAIYKAYHPDHPNAEVPATSVMVVDAGVVDTKVAAHEGHEGTPNSVRKVLNRTPSPNCHCHK